MDSLARQLLKDAALEEIAPKAAHPNPTALLDHWSPAILLERAAYLKKMARYGDGSASETLREYPRHTVALLFRNRDSDGEMYRNSALLLCVLAGSATLVSGGTLVRAQIVAPCLTRGNSVEGGTRKELTAGEIAHVPAGLPHQILVAGEKSVTCLVVKIEEDD